MSEPIGPGDFVECVDASPRGPTGTAHLFLSRGAVYRVELAGATRYSSGRVEWLRLKGIRGLDVPSGGGFYALRFRPIYRPKRELIEGLLKPVKEDA